MVDINNLAGTSTPAQATTGGQNPAATAPAAQPAPPSALPATPQSTNPSSDGRVSVTPAGKSNKLLIIGGVVLLILAAAGVWWYTQQNLAPAPAPQTQKQADPTVAGLKKELDSLVISEVEADFTAVDQDLNSL